VIKYLEFKKRDMENDEVARMASKEGRNERVDAKF